MCTDGVVETSGTVNALDFVRGQLIQLFPGNRFVHDEIAQALNVTLILQSAVTSQKCDQSFWIYMKQLFVTL